MGINVYTSTTDVRAVLGVSSTELPDAQLDISIYETVITLALEDINTGIPTEFATVSALPSGSRTANQQRFYDLVRLFAPYALAKNLLTSLPLFGVQRLTDGKAEFQRQADIITDVRDGIDSAFQALRYRLSAAYIALYPVATPLEKVVARLAGAVPLGIDPVTNA